MEKIIKRKRFFRLAFKCIIFLGLFFFASAKFLTLGQDKFESIDTIIVLGYPCTSEGSISPIQKSRVDKGIALFNLSGASAIVFTGGAAHNTFIESEIMRDYALDKGLNENHIIIESNSQTTYENSKFTASLMKDKSKNYLLVTSNFHTRRAKLIFEKQFPNLQVAGSPYPKNTGLLKLAAAIVHEYLGFCYYYIIQKGT